MFITAAAFDLGNTSVIIHPRFKASEKLHPMVQISSTKSNLDKL